MIIDMILENLIKKILTLIKLIIRIYSAFISPFLPKACRYYPSCSEYYIEAIDKYKFKGIILGFIRILKCNPFFKGGYDPVMTNVKNNSNPLSINKLSISPSINIHKE